MDDLNLGSDEAIQKKFPKIIINGVRYEAVLTNRRFVLTERETGAIFEDILHSDITLAVSGINSIREPTLQLNINPPAAEERSLELIFVYQPGGMNVQNLESCVEILQAHQVTVQRIKSPNSAGPMNRIQALTPGMQTGAEGESRPAVPTMGLFGSLRSGRELPPEESGKTPWLIAIAAIVVILAVIAAGAFLAGQGTSVPVNTTTTQAPVNTPVVTLPAGTPVPVSPIPVVSPAQPAVPVNGIWIHVSYKGQYSGNIRAKGWGTDINSTGSLLTQMPVENALIEGSLEKMDGSGDLMEVIISNGGRPIWRGETTKPYGMVEIRVETGAAIISSPEPGPKPVPPPAVPTPDPSIALKEVPPTGMYLRVCYAGDFSGTLAGNRVEREVEGTGDQFFQVPVAGRSIDAEVAKDDGSDRDMVVQLYKDSTLILTRNTSRPFGVIEIHTSI